MAFTYNIELTTDKDWVRFLIVDRDVSLNDNSVSKAYLSDEEINALLQEEENKYLAAARAGEILLNRSKGLVHKEVEELSIEYADSAESTYQIYINKLRERGNELLRDDSRFFRAL